MENGALCLAAFLTLIAGAIPAGAFGYSGVWRGAYDYWIPIALRGARLEGDWIVGIANVALHRSPEELASLNFVVAHFCTWTGSEWKCGCRDEACDGSFWQLQAFRRR